MMSTLIEKTKITFSEMELDKIVISSLIVLSYFMFVLIPVYFAFFVLGVTTVSLIYAWLLWIRKKPD